jgi:hypothetical protein
MIIAYLSGSAHFGDRRISGGLPIRLPEGE